MSCCAIIIVNWNSWNYLFDCLEAVYAQTFQDFQVIVVDNASDDAPQAERLSGYPRLRCLLNTENKGFAAANNQAIYLAAESRWVVLLNPDTLPEPDWLERLVEAAHTNPAFSTFGSCLIQSEDRTLLDGYGDVYHISGMAWRAGHGRPIAEAPSADCPIFSPCAAAALYERAAILAVGGLDERFFCYHEDVDLGFRLQLAGFRAMCIPGSRVVHMGSGTTSFRSSFAVYHGHRNLIWTWFKDLPLPLLLLSIPAHLFWNLALILLYAARGQGRIILKAKWDGYRGLPALLSKRKTVQAKRTIPLAALWRLVDKRFFLGARN